MPDRFILEPDRAEGEPGRGWLLVEEVVKLLVERARLQNPKEALSERGLLTAALSHGEFVVFGFSRKLQRRVRIPSPWRHEVGFDAVRRAWDKTEFYEYVAFYQQAEVVQQSERAKLLARVIAFLESETKADPPRATKRVGWQRIVLHDITGTSKNLFREAWRDARLPAALRRPGRPAGPRKSKG
jgi:hypothetical protein